MDRAPSIVLPPAMGLVACVVIPAHMEAGKIGSCIRALAAQQEVERSSYEVIVVLSEADDETEGPLKVVADMYRGLAVHVMRASGDGPGPARRAGMDAACERLLAAGRPQGLIASTDADSTVAPDWLGEQLLAVRRGARAIGGRIELGEEDFEALPPAVARWRRERAVIRHRGVERQGLHAGVPSEHWQFSGASIGITAEAYREIGGLDPVSALEDEALERALHRHGIPIHRLTSVKVTTSGRLTGRARRGLARDLELATWLESNTFAARDFTVEGLLDVKTATVSVVLPTLNVSATLGGILDQLVPLRDKGLIDELIVVDAGSVDGTAGRAVAAGVKVVLEADLMPNFGPPRGKGDALWRSLAATGGDVVVFIDTDTSNFQPGYVLGLLGPLLKRPEIDFVKGAFRRPLKIGDELHADEGGRVTELVARPLLNLYVPELAGFVQPLAGETAARREVLEGSTFPVGYGVEIALLIDTLRTRGLPAMAQVDLGTRQNRHQPLKSLGAMAYAVMVAAGRRVHPPGSIEAAAPGPFLLPTQDGLDARSVPVEERPPMATLDRRKSVAETAG